MNTLRQIFIGLFLAVVAYCIAASLAEWYIDQLKHSGGIVTASEIIGAQFAPWGVAIAVFAGYLKFTLE